MNGEKIATTIHGIAGTIEFQSHLGNPDLIYKQVFTTEMRGPKNNRIKAFIRFDDECKNGHNSFAITGEMYDYTLTRNQWHSGGCIHDDVAKAFPEIAHLIKWHLTDSTCPMHYLANATYHASDRDHNGLLKGESRQIISGKSGLPAWRLEAVDANGVALPYGEIGKSFDGITPPENPNYSIKWVPWCIIGEGKARNFDAARSCAVWPEATDAQLSLPRSELTALLEARHAGLVAAFKADILAAGLKWDSRS